MTDNMWNIIINMAFVMWFQQLHNEEKLNIMLIFDRLHFNQFSCLFCWKMQRKLSLFDLFVRKSLEKWQKIFFHVFNWIVWTKNCIDDVGTVISVVKLEKIISYRFMSQSINITNRKSTERTLAHFSENFPFTTIVIICGKNKLFVNCLTLFVNAVRIKKCRIKKFH